MENGFGEVTSDFSLVDVETCYETYVAGCVLSYSSVAEALRPGLVFAVVFYALDEAAGAVSDACECNTDFWAQACSLFRRGDSRTEKALEASGIREVSSPRTLLSSRAIFMRMMLLFRTVPGESGEALVILRTLGDAICLRLASGSLRSSTFGFTGRVPFQFSTEV